MSAAAPRVGFLGLGIMGAQMASRLVGTGQNVMAGNPVGSITWLANHLKTRGHSLKAGNWVSSGSAAEMLPVPASGTVKGDFGSLGTVEVSFS